ncbi:glycosyltransferase [Luteimonas fraxinea]|uniref:glycosyltransferase n=1 Tax=Luteimonas fraxinea TaxID=2901869 RepID=UPI0022B78544|nr:glycosyltransferase [Luteimonas fraxinea]
MLPDLRPGGAEKLHVNLAKAWGREGVSVEFVLCRNEGELISDLPPDVKVTDLGAARMRSALLPLARYLRNSRADVILAAMWPLTVIVPVAARIAGFKGQVVVSEHSPLSIAFKDRGRMHNIALRLSMRLAYPLANQRIGVSRGVADDLASLSGLPRSNFRVIYNPAALGVSLGVGEQTPDLLAGAPGPVIISVGTLKRVKRFDLLIRAFSEIPSHFRVTLCILGEGNERAALEQLATSLGLQDRVLLPGFVTDPGPWYRAASLFALASDYEGFGNVIVEALEQGLPVVSTDCPSGPHEILCDGKYGRLVPVGNAAALSDSLVAALQEKPDRELLKSRARDFSLDKISREYLSLMLTSKRSMT